MNIGSESEAEVISACRIIEYQDKGYLVEKSSHKFDWLENYQFVFGPR